MNEGPFKHDSNHMKANHLFKPVSWLSKIDFIHHLTLFNNVLMVVLGEKEAGKSSFLSLLQLSFDHNFHVMMIKATVSMDMEDLKQEMIREFNLKQGDISSIVVQINAQKAHVVLMIDNAHYLPESWMAEVLAAIRDQGNHGYFHLCLAADYSIVSSLNHLVNKEFNNLVHTIELGGLNENETKTYVLHRAQREGFDESLFSEEVFQKIYKSSAGDFAKINGHLNQYMNGIQKNSLNKTILARTSLAVCLALAILGITYTLTNGSYLSETFRNIFSKPISGELVVENESSMKLQNLQKPLKSAMPYWKDFASFQPLTPAPPLQSSISSIEENEFVPKSALVDKVIYIPKINIAKKPSQEKSSSNKIQLSSLTKTPLFHGSKGAATSFPSKNTKKIKARQNKRYTIQLVAAIRRSTIKNFVEKYHLSKKTKIYQRTDKNGHWYILTLGEYENLNQAKNDIHHLPYALVKFHPWVRPLSELKRLG
ncbi:AAA family ATPase [Legionella israelensis]|uniref:DamX-related protein n=1 Tax=Legionella israelensis TaxID=454 RepID=A0A0W0VVK0_9GAMM|nr:AAA family ATPase [Legionella israelensis]KTD23718.1 DamX-related protein [Legionella israelensis]QBS10902.1 hypothetical protein E4T55_14270 [Legionella israelensis]SCX80179.1 Type II secretory pathway, component ExeA (predicted ATPase) [Legionella israelensis DSM 19235]STX57890.1 DamX-like protein [Legionella israelensis]